MSDTAGAAPDPRPEWWSEEQPGGRRFGWWDMFVHPDDDPRTDSDIANTEHATLAGFLRNRRLTLELKCSGLGAADLARRSVEPSDLSLLGLVRHMADVERYWFRRRLAGQDAPPLYRSASGRSEDFDGAVADPEVVARAWEDWRAEIAFAERFVDTAPDLGALGAAGDPIRQVMVHMIEEYARHNGHADLIRERIDGRVGQ